MRKRERFSRRAFLKATGSSPLLLPLLEPELARAGCLTSGPKRAVFVIWGNGSLPGNGSGGQWWPTEGNPALCSGLASLEPHKSDLIFIDQLNYRFIVDSPAKDAPTVIENGHYSTPGLLTGRRFVPGAAAEDYEWRYRASGPSIDQHMGEALARTGYTGLPSLYLGVRMTNPVYACWRGSDAPVAPEWDPPRIFSKLFAGRTGGGPDPELQRLQRARKSVLDSVRHDFDRFARIVGTADRARIERHLDSIRSIEKDLLAERQQLACEVPALDTGAETTIDPTVIKFVGDGSPLDPAFDQRIPRLLKFHMDILVAALATDVVRVGVLQLSDTRDPDWGMPWLGLTISHHLTAHKENDNKLKADKWLYGQWAYLIQKLKEEKEGNSSVLDNSVVAFLNTMTTGGHQLHNVPAFLAGSCGGTFKTGRTITNRAAGRYHQPLLVSIANAMGAPPPGNSWGDPEYNSGEMAGLRG